jgi:hypothetical protein
MNLEVEIKIFNNVNMVNLGFIQNWEFSEIPIIQTLIWFETWIIACLYTVDYRKNKIGIFKWMNCLNLKKLGF